MKTGNATHTRTCFDVLRTTGVSGLTEFLWHSTLKKSWQGRQKKGWILTDPSLLSSEHMKRETKGREGRGEVWKWVKALQSQQMVWKHTSTHTDTHETWYHKPQHIARVRYDESDAVGVAWRDAIPPFGESVRLGTICLSSWTCRKLTKPGYYINPAQYGSALRNWSFPKPSLLFSHDAEGSAEHPQPNLQQGWGGGGGGGRCVDVCARSGDWANCTHRITDRNPTFKVCAVEISIDHLFVFHFKFHFVFISLSLCSIAD